MLRRTSEYIELRALWEVNCARVRGHFSAWRLSFVATLKRPYFLSFSPTVRVCVCAHIIDQGLVCLIRSIDSNMADLGLHITLLPIIGQALPRSAATCQNQLLVLQIGLCLFLYVFPVFEHLSVLFCSVLLFLAAQQGPVKLLLAAAQVPTPRRPMHSGFRPMDCGLGTCTHVYKPQVQGPR